MKKAADFVYRIWDRERKAYCASHLQDSSTATTLWLSFDAVKKLSSKWYNWYSAWYHDQCNDYLDGKIKTHPGRFLSKSEKYEVRRFKMTNQTAIPFDDNGVLQAIPDDRKTKRKRKQKTV